MTDTIEPTEDQKQAAALQHGYSPNDSYVRDWIKGTSRCPVPTGPFLLARLLAEREHKLLEKADLARAATERQLLDLRKIHRDQLQADLDAARARIAELEASQADLLRQHYLDLHNMKAATEREAAHLAHIKALHQFIGDREEEEGIWIPRAEFKDIPKHDTAHYDVEGGEG
jgi:hypothetical protein